jgi:anti-sigma factor RsiW
MNCKELKNIIPNYLDNELSKKQIIEFNNHLSSCAECSRVYTKTKETLDLLKPKAEIDEQAFYFTVLKQKMESRNIPEESIFATLLSRKLVQPMIYLSSLIIAVYIGILIGSSTGSSVQNQFSDLSSDENNYIKTYTEYQYLNDSEIETIENLLIDEDTLTQK